MRAFPPRKCITRAVSKVYNVPVRNSAERPAHHVFLPVFWYVLRVHIRMDTVERRECMSYGVEYAVSIYPNVPANNLPTQRNATC